MAGKINVGLVYGGNSFEYEVSKLTAESILENIDENRFDITKIHINNDGKFNEELLDDIDVAFLAVHGPNCEDGKLQDYLEKRGIKYTGSGVEASRLNMNKIDMHEAFKKGGLPVVKFFGFDPSWKTEEVDTKIKKEFCYPIFIKSNNAGSSVGVNKVTDSSSLKEAIKKAFQYDCKAIAEEAVVNPREIELAVLGNNELIISNPGEILSNGKFYSYDTKYFKPFETSTSAKLGADQVKDIKAMAEKAYRITGCRGYSRIDLLMDQNEKVYINEINTLPGFTKISMFPKLMKESGISYTDLISRIIELALE